MLEANDLNTHIAEINNPDMSQTIDNACPRNDNADETAEETVSQLRRFFDDKNSPRIIYNQQNWNQKQKEEPNIVTAGAHIICYRFVILIVILETLWWETML